MIFSLFLLSLTVTLSKSEIIGNDIFNVKPEECENLLNILNKDHYVCFSKKKEIEFNDVEDLVKRINEYIDIESITNFIENNNKEIEYTKNSVTGEVKNIYNLFLMHFKDYISSIDTFVKTSYIILNDRTSYQTKISKILSNFGEIVGYEISKNEFEVIIEKNILKINSVWRNFIFDVNINHSKDLIKNQNLLKHFFEKNNEEILEILNNSFDKMINRIQKHIDNSEEDTILFQDLVVNIFPEQVDDCSSFMKEKYMTEDIICTSINKEGIKDFINYYYNIYSM